MERQTQTLSVEISEKANADWNKCPQLSGGESQQNKKKNEKGPKLNWGGKYGVINVDEFKGDSVKQKRHNNKKKTQTKRLIM